MHCPLCSRDEPVACDFSLNSQQTRCLRRYENNGLTFSNRVRHHYRIPNCKVVSFLRVEHVMQSLNFRAPSEGVRHGFPPKLVQVLLGHDVVPVEGHVRLTRAQIAVALVL